MKGGSSSSAGSSRRGGGVMRARVCSRVRTPQGVGALLLVGGAIVGAAVVAWRRHACRRGDGKGSKNQPREQPATEQALDGVVEDEQVQGIDQSAQNLSRDGTEAGANGLDGKATEELLQIQNGKATEELHEIQEEDEIVMDESVCFSMQSAGQICINDGGPVEKFDQNSSRKSAEIIADDTDSGDVKKVDQNSSKSDIEDEITPNATEGVENSDQCTLTMSSPEIAHEEHNEHDDAAQETASTQTTPTTQMMAHEPQIFEEAKADTVTETAQAEVAEATTMEKNVLEQEEQKPLAEQVEIATSPVNSSMSSLLKPTEKKGPANPGWNERGMKLEQDCISGELSKGGATKGVAVVTMDRRAASMAILALIFAVTIGVNIVLRLFYPLQAT